MPQLTSHDTDPQFHGTLGQTPEKFVSSVDSSTPDVISSAASPTPTRKLTRWDSFLLFNVAIPILLLVGGFAIFKLLGEAEAKSLPPADTSAAALMKSLPPARAERVRSLAETGAKLELAIDGTVVPFREAVVSSEVAGRVIFKSDGCEAGSIVKQGEVLMRIDPVDYELDVQRLTRQREQEYRALGETDQEMANTRRLIEVAREDVKIQQRELERQTSLKTFASASERDKAKTALLKSSQQLVTLENQLSLLATKRSRLESSEQLAATQLRVAEVNLERCEITAPISGIIVSEQADLNTFVNRGTPLLTIEDTTQVEVAANMRMDQLQWVLKQEEGEKNEGYDLPDTPAIIEYEVAGRDSIVHRWNGMLVSFDGIGIDPNTRTVPVRIIVSDPRHFIDESGQQKVADRTNALLRGMFVSVRLQLKPAENLIVIPARALRPGNRVWKFTPDPTLIDKMAQKIKDAKEAAEKAASEGGEEEKADGGKASAAETPKDAKGDSVDSDEESEAAEDTFDASQWQAGLVTFSKRVYPIESLRLSEPEKPDPSLSPSLQSIGRDWICETDEADLSGGAMVVTSPLDSIPPDGLSVRVKAVSQESKNP